MGASRPPLVEALVSEAEIARTAVARSTLAASVAAARQAVERQRAARQGETLSYHMRCGPERTGKWFEKKTESVSQMFEEEPESPRRPLQEAACAARLWTGTGVLVERRGGSLGVVHRGEVE